MAWLACMKGDDQGFVCALSEGQSLVMGSSEECAIRLRAAEVGIEHCAVTLKGQILMVEDLGTGITVNGRRHRKTTVKIATEESFQLGNDSFKFLYTYEQYVKATSRDQPDEDDRTPMSREEMKAHFARLATETAVRRREKEPKSWLRRLLGR